MKKQLKSEEVVEAMNEQAAEETTEQTEKTEKKPSAKERAVAYLKGMPKRYFITAFSGMAMGLFCTLIAGTILEQIGKLIGDNGFGNLLIAIAAIAKMLMGAGIGVGIAHKLNAKPLVIFTAAVAGLIGAYSNEILAGTLIYTNAEGVIMTALISSSKVFPFLTFKPGNPIGAYVVVMLTVEIAGLYAGKTNLDIVIVPLGMLLLCIAGIFLAWPFIQLIDLLAKLIVLLIEAGEVVKVLTGIVVAVVMGILLTMPTSSAAIWIAIAMSEVAKQSPEAFAIAGGAAVAGCAAHMVGFAVASFRENKWSGLVSQGIGTSMLQIPNIMKKPIIMVPEIVASAISGLVAVLMGLRCNPAGGGMGTSGLVGVIGAYAESTNAGMSVALAVVAIALCLFIIPAAVCLLLSELMRKKGWIKEGDMKLEL